MKLRTVTALSLLCLAAVMSFGARPFPVEEPLPLEPERVRMVGLLTEELRFGPPNYGETPGEDIQVTVPILVVSPTVAVKADSNGVANVSVDRIQLLFLDQARRDRYVGQTVEVNGSLFHAEGGQHYTTIVMSVESIHRL